LNQNISTLSESQFWIKWLVSNEPMHRSAEKHIAFRTLQFPSTASLHERNDCSGLCYPNQRLSLFNNCGAFFRVTLFRWHTRWTVLKRIFCHNVINDWVSQDPNYFCCWAPSAKAFDDRGTSILGSNIAAILRIWYY